MFLDIFLEARVSGRGLFHDLADFDNDLFPTNWHIVYDTLGSGCRIDFPVRFTCRLKWSSDKNNGVLTARPRTFTEMISVALLKMRC